MPSLKNKIDRNADKCYWPSKITDEIQWFYYQYLSMHALENSTNNPNDVLLISLLKVFFSYVLP